MLLVIEEEISVSVTRGPGSCRRHLGVSQEKESVCGAAINLHYNYIRCWSLVHEDENLGQVFFLLKKLCFRNDRFIRRANKCPTGLLVLFLALSLCSEWHAKITLNNVLFYLLVLRFEIGSSFAKQSIWITWRTRTSQIYNFYSIFESKYWV